MVDSLLITLWRSILMGRTWPAPGVQTACALPLYHSLPRQPLYLMDCICQTPCGKKTRYWFCVPAPNFWDIWPNCEIFVYVFCGTCSDDGSTLQKCPYMRGVPSSQVQFNVKSIYWRTEKAIQTSWQLGVLSSQVLLYWQVSSHHRFYCIDRCLLITGFTL